jgi:two-component system, LytTR family, response regulator
MAIRVLLVDASSSAALRLRSLLALQPDLEIVGVCATRAAAAAAIRLQAPAVVFLDAALPDGDGFALIDELAPALRPVVIATSDGPDGTLRAFDTGAIDYVVKPVEAVRLGETLQRLRRQLERPMPAARAARTFLKRIIVRENERLIVLPAAHVDWMESANNYIVLHAGRATHVLRETLTNLEQRLSPAQFLRISRFAIVNLDRIRELKLTAAGDHVAVMTDGIEVPLTRGIREIQEYLQFA